MKIHGTEVPIASPEDVMVPKLEWARMGESARQLEDAATMLRVRYEELDLECVEYWVGELELAEQWARARRAAGVE